MTAEKTTATQRLGDSIHPTPPAMFLPRMINAAIRDFPAGPSPATMLATPGQRRIALWTCVAIALVSFALLPVAGEHWPRIPAFIGIYQTTVIFSYLICAYLLFGQFRATRAQALLYLGGGCLYTGLILIAQLLSFPDVFAASGLLPGGAQTTIWLWCFWHAGPSIGMLLYACAEWRRPEYVSRRPKRAVRRAIVIVAALLGMSITLVTAFQDWLPNLDNNGNFGRITTLGIAPALEVMTAGALFVLWRNTHFRTVLQLWLAVSLFALLFDNGITMAGASRLSVGWYIGRFNALISSVVLLLVYLRDLNRLYRLMAADLGRAVLEKVEVHDALHLARRDSLTELPARAMFLEMAGSMMSRSRVQSARMAMMLIDLDGFKAVNDTYGHWKGDEVLIKVARVLKDALRDTDVLGRLGGDEFAVCISAPADLILERAGKIADRIVESMARIGDGIGCSVGVSLRPLGSEELDAALRDADVAMYEAKRRGKNQYVMFDGARMDAVHRKQKDTRSVPAAACQ
jgi:diguanylate cyclase (GGDEF)-like protein